MKEDLKIEELFKQKFENFEGNVDPSAWANISQSIGSGAAGGATGAAGGLSGFAKVAIVVGVAAVTAVGVWKFSGDAEEETKEDNTTVVSDNNDNDQDNATDEIVATDNTNNVVDNNDVVVDENDNTVVDENNVEESNNIEENIEPDNSNDSSDNGNSNSNNENNSDNEDISNPNDNTDVENDQDDEEIVIEKLIIVANPAVSSKEGNAVSFASNTRNVDEVFWDLGDGNTATGNNPEHEYERPGKYTVKVKVKKSARGKTIQKNYTLIVDIEGTSEISEVPNVFTPNGDNNNDYFFIESTEIKEFKIVIFDMNTQKEVFQSTDVNFKWDGKDYEGSVKKGRYIYQIYAVGNDGAEIKRNGPLQINM